MEILDLAQSLFAALAGQDEAKVRELCSPDLIVQQNGGPPMNLATLLAFNRAVGRIVQDFRYEDQVRSASASGFVEEHRVRGRLPDDSTLDLQVCVVADVSDGKVSAVREYFDSAAAAGLIAALS